MGLKRLVTQLIWYPCGEPYKQYKQFHHANLNGDNSCSRVSKGTRRILCLEYTL